MGFQRSPPSMLPYLVVENIIYAFLQCAIPMFEGLLPDEHNKRLIRLLFLKAHWHGLAKLRVHTDLSLEIMDDLTVLLAKSLKEFKKHTCSAYPTFELKREAEAQSRRQIKAQKKGSKRKSMDATPNPSTAPALTPMLTISPIPAAQAPIIVATPSIQVAFPAVLSNSIATVPASHGSLSPTSLDKTTLNSGAMHPSIPPSSSSQPSSIKAKIPNIEKPVRNSERRHCKLKTLNLNTYKFHASDDVTSAIQMYGTTDSYSTEPV